MSAEVEIVEVGPRDGLQNEARTLDPDVRIAFVEALAAAGLSTIEVGSFVAPKWVPQMAGTDEVVRRLPPAPDRARHVLVPNLKGLGRAIEAGARTVSIFPAASETFSRRNLNASRAEAMARFGEVATAALERGLSVRGCISCAVHCPFEGFVPAADVADLAEALMRLGSYQVVVCDTTGRGTPGEVRTMIAAVADRIGVGAMAGHFHDTTRQGLANVLTALEMGVRVFDASTGGLGGCPYSPGATGNLATEELVYMLNGMGVSTGVSLGGLAAAYRVVEGPLGRADGGPLFRVRGVLGD